MSRIAYFITAIVLLTIGLAFAIVMQIGIANIPQQDSKAQETKARAPQALPQPELKPTITGAVECDRAYIKGYTHGFKNGVNAYCGAGTVIKEIIPNLMCYDNGYDRGFTQGVSYAARDISECIFDTPY